MSLKSLVSNLEKFTGENKITVLNWCNLVDDAFSIEGWTDKQQLVLASQQLADAAATWYEASRHGKKQFQSWKDLKKGLLERFGGTGSASVARLELMRLRWQEDQDLEEHITRFITIRSRIGDASDAELTSLFRQTLPDDYLNDSLYHDPDTLEKAIAHTRSLYASRRHGLREPVRRLPRSDPTGPAPMDLDTQQLVRSLHALGVRTNYTRDGGADQRKCYNCGLRGHIARFCNNRRPYNQGGQDTRQRSFSPRQPQQFRNGPHMNARTHRLAEIAYQFEQESQQQPSLQPAQQEEQGKEPRQ
jgi:hypothetical protein